MGLSAYCVLAVWVGAAQAPGRLDVTVTRTGQEVAIDNPWPAATPTITIVGLPDRSTKPVRKTKGVTLAGVRLSETCLSESVLILHPNGTGRWGYYGGYDIFRLPDTVDPRTRVEYDKWRYDPLTPVSVSGGDMNLLHLCRGKQQWPAVYELAFPTGMTIRRLTVNTNQSGFAPGARIIVELFADAGLTQRLDAREVAFEKRPWFPIVFDKVARPRVVVRISGHSTGRKLLSLYWLKMEADLDCPGLTLPALKPGRNVWRFTDDADSSHRARLVVRWPRKPAQADIWEDFEADRSPFGGEVKLVGPRHGKTDAFTGRRFARVGFVVDGKARMLHRTFPKPLDLSAYNRLSIAVRGSGRAGHGPIVFGIRNADTFYQYVRLSPRPRWRVQEFDISKMKRDRVTMMNLYVYQSIGYWKRGQRFDLDVDTICFHRAAPAAPKPRPELPAHVLAYRSPWQNTTPPKRTLPPLREWFPLGVYAGFPDERAWPFMLDDMKRHHMNALYVSNGRLSVMTKMLPLAEARAIRLIYQGTGAGELYYLHYSGADARRSAYRNAIVPAATQWLPRLRGRWGLAAWSLTEEISPEVARELADYYALVRRLDPTHPPTVLHNHLGAAEADLATSRPVVITHDFYPFFWAPMNGPSTPRRSLAFYRSRVSSYYRACRKHGASLWMMPQSWGHQPEPNLDPPYYGYRSGMRQPEPGEIKLQGWVAIAEGATGIMFYLYQSNRPDVSAPRDLQWQPTAMLGAMGELFARVGRVGPLLCRLERDHKEKGFVTVAAGRAIAHTFAKRKGYPGSARYVVVASTDGFKAQTVRLEVNTTHVVFDLVSGRQLTGPERVLKFGPGEGTVLAVGTEADIQADRHMIERERAALR